MKHSHEMNEYCTKFMNQVVLGLRTSTETAPLTELNVFIFRYQKSLFIRQKFLTKQNASILDIFF